jgi:hypothetical protein
MKAVLLAINHAYLFFGTTLYVGVLWSMRFFWYPSWGQITLADVPVHFMGPTSRATAFFTVVVPLMFLTGVIMVAAERKTPMVFLAALALLCIASATFVGQYYIIPVNKEIVAGLPTQELLHDKLGAWMEYNTIRFWLMTLMWGVMMLYFVLRGHLLSALAGRQL